MVSETVQLTAALVVVCLLSGLSLAMVYDTTKPYIDENQRKALEIAQKEVFPSGERFDELADHPLISTEKEGVRSVYAGYIGDAVAGYALKVEGIGFGGSMKLLVGVEVKDGKATVTGIKVLEHLETPGLGERINEDFFKGQFAGKEAPLRTNQFDTITGATISSSKVVQMVIKSVNTLHTKGGGV